MYDALVTQSVRPMLTARVRSALPDAPVVPEPEHHPHRLARLARRGRKG